MVKRNLSRIIDSDSDDSLPDLRHPMIRTINETDSESDDPMDSRLAGPTLYAAPDADHRRPDAPTNQPADQRRQAPGIAVAIDEGFPHQLPDRPRQGGGDSAQPLKQVLINKLFKRVEGPITTPLAAKKRKKTPVDKPDDSKEDVAQGLKTIRAASWNPNGLASTGRARHVLEWFAASRYNALLLQSHNLDADMATKIDKACRDKNIIGRTVPASDPMSGVAIWLKHADEIEAAGGV